MNIAFIGQKGIPVSQGGVERHVEELACRLAMRGHKILVYNHTSYKTRESSLTPGIKIVKILTVSVKGWDTIIASFLATLDVIFRRIDIIHYHSIGPAFFIFLPKLFKPSVKIVFTHHTYEAQRPQWGALARLALNLGEKVGMKFADEVIAISPTVATTLEAKYKRLVSTVPNGVSRFLADSEVENEAKKVTPPENYILAVSRLIRSKGLDHLINAFNLIAADYPEYHLVIVGSPTNSDDDRPRLERLASDSDRIHFFGWQPSSRLTEYYQKASLFVQPSEIEGLPITLLEAASYALPIIASDIPEHTIILRSEAVSFRSGNHIDLAAKIRQVLANLPFYKSTAVKLSERVNKEFDWDKITENILKIYGRRSLNSKILVARST